MSSSGRLGFQSSWVRYRLGCDWSDLISITPPQDSSTAELEATYTAGKLAAVTARAGWHGIRPEQDDSSLWGTTREMQHPWGWNRPTGQVTVGCSPIVHYRHPTTEVLRTHKTTRG